MDKTETLMVVVVFLAVFTLAFSFAAWLNSQNTSLYGYRIISSKQASLALKEALNKSSLILRQELTEGVTKENSAVGAVSAEFIYAAGVTGIQVYPYAVVDRELLNSSCSANNSFCGEADIVVSIDDSQSPCNCIIVNNNNSINILGSSDFLFENAANIRQVVYVGRSR